MKVGNGKKSFTVEIDEKDFLYMEKVKRELNGTSKRVGLTWAQLILQTFRMAYPEKKIEEKEEDLWRID